MLKIFTLLISLLFFNTAHAEIIQSVNSFDNAKITMSYFHNKELKLPRVCIFKKYNDEYFLILNSAYKVSKFATNLEPTRLKIDNELYSITPNTYDLGYKQIISLPLTPQIISHLSQATKVSMQIPVDNDTKYLVDYLIVDVPQNYIEEWKQIIIAK